MVYTQVSEFQLKSHRLDRFCSGGFQPTEEKNASFSEFRRNETFKMCRSYGTQMLYHAIFNGLNRSGEPPRCYKIDQAYGSLTKMI